LIEVNNLTHTIVIVESKSNSLKFKLWFHVNFNRSKRICWKVCVRICVVGISPKEMLTNAFVKKFKE